MKRFYATVVSAVVCGTFAVTAAQAGGGKVQICHMTGSATNPYVLVDVSVNAQDAHATNHGDVSPGTDGSCPQAPGGNF
jgi:hypothetical protein